VISWVKDIASLYAGALRQLTTGRMGGFGLCYLFRLFMEGAEGFKFTNFHFEFGG
jgi:hypothetical protein